MKSGCFTNMQSLDLHRKLSHLERFQMCAHCKDRTARPSCINSFASDGLKRNVECSAPFLSCSGGNGAEIIKGTDFKSEPLFGGSVRNLLQNSAINSSAASFSDRQLVGSQERGVFSVTTSAKLGDKNSMSRASISNLSGEAIIKVNLNEKDAVVAENSVRSPPDTNAFERVCRNSKKRKRIVDAVGSIEHLYSKGKKLHHQIEEKLYSLHDVLGGLSEKFSEYDGHLAPNVHFDPYMECDKRKNSSIQGGVLQRLHDTDTDKQKEEKLEIKGSGEDCTPASQRVNTSIIQAQFNKGQADDFAELVDVDYMKLLELDNTIDEERYQMAVKMPMSPTLPDIQLLSVDAIKSKCLEESLCEEILNNWVPSCSSEVMDIEVDSNGLHPTLLGTSYNPLSKQCKESVRSPKILEQSKNGLCTSPNSGEAGGQQIWCTFKELDPQISQNLGASVNFPYERGTTDSSIPTYFIVFSDGMERSSLSRIYGGTRAFVSRFSLCSEKKWFQEVLIALLQEKCLLPREKVCVLSSFLLHQVSTVAPWISGNFLTKESIGFLHSFTCDICMGMSNVETRSMFANICNLEDLSILIGEFLISRKVMVYKDASTESLHRCESRIDTVLDGTFVFLSSGVALNRQLVAGSIILASICVAVGQFGLMCEISFNIFRSQSFDSTLALTILHIFAFLGGKKYMDLNSYSFTMAVVKSMVTFIETNKLSVAAPSPNEISPVLLPCHKCPFSESVLPVDAVTSLLLDKLQSCTLSSTKVLTETVELMSSSCLSNSNKDQQSSGLEGFLCILDVPCDESCLNGYLTVSSQSKAALGLNLCNLTDILSLVELIAYTMTWEWISDKIIPRLLKILESSVQEIFSAGIVTLLGQIGRLGVDQTGYEDMEVQNLRCRLSAFLESCTNKKSSLHFEVSTVYALLGLLSLDFEELIRGNVASPAVGSESAPADLIRNWFYLLSNEQQCLILGLFEADGGHKNQVT